MPDPFSRRKPKQPYIAPQDALPVPLPQRTEPPPQVTADEMMPDVEQEPIPEILGRPVRDANGKEMFTPTELARITQLESEYLERLGNDPSKKPLVQDCVRAELDLRRASDELSKLSAPGQFRMTTKAVKLRKNLTDIVKMAQDRLDEALKRCGLGVNDDREGCSVPLSTLYLRYKKALEERREERKPGELDEESKSLAKSNDLDPARYTIVGAMPDGAREVLLGLPDGPPPDEVK